MSIPRLLGCCGLLGLLLTPGAAAAQSAGSAPPGDRVHQNACQQDADGWCTASSPGGHFNVSIPAPFFNESSFRDKDQEGHALHLRVIGAHTPEGVKISVICIFKPEVPATAEVIKNAVEAMGKTGTLVDHQPTTVDGLHGEHVHLAKQDSSADVWILLGQSTIYQVIVEYPPAAATVAAKILPRLLASFSVKGAPEPVNPAAP